MQGAGRAATETYQRGRLGNEHPATPQTAPAVAFHRAPCQRLTLSRSASDCLSFVFPVRAP